MSATPAQSAARSAALRAAVPGIQGAKLSPAASDALDAIKEALWDLEQIATPAELDAAYKGLAIQLLSRIQ